MKSWGFCKHLKYRNVCEFSLDERKKSLFYLHLIRSVARALTVTGRCSALQGVGISKSRSKSSAVLQKFNYTYKNISLYLAVQRGVKLHLTIHLPAL